MHSRAAEQISRLMHSCNQLLRHPRKYSPGCTNRRHTKRLRKATPIVRDRLRQTICKDVSVTQWCNESTSATSQTLTEFGSKKCARNWARCYLTMTELPS